MFMSPLMYQLKYLNEEVFGTPKKMGESGQKVTKTSSHFVTY